MKELIVGFLVKLVDSLRRNSLTTLERMEKTRARLFNKYFRKSKKKELKKLKKELSPEKFQEHIINEANENLEREVTDQRGGSMVEQSNTEKSN